METDAVSKSLSNTKIIQQENRILIKPEFETPFDTFWNIDNLLLKRADFKPVHDVLDFLKYYHFTPYIGGSVAYNSVFGSVSDQEDIDILGVASLTDKKSQEEYANKVIEHLYHYQSKIVEIGSTTFLSYQDGNRNFLGTKIETRFKLEPRESLVKRIKTEGPFAAFSGRRTIIDLGLISSEEFEKKFQEQK
jgi:hypothetical protein